MKNYLRFHWLLLLLLPSGLAWGQGCVIDSQYASPGVYASNTLPAMDLGDPVDETLTIVLLGDTFFQGFNIVFDSATLHSVTGLPTYLSTACGGAIIPCHYPLSPDTLFRTCMRFTGTCNQQNPSYPLYDTIVVTHYLWVTILLTPQPQPFDDTIYYRCGPPVAAQPPGTGPSGLQVISGAGQDRVEVAFSLREAGPVLLEVIDGMGRLVMQQQQTILTPGNCRMGMHVAELPQGMYIIRLRPGGGQHPSSTKWLHF